MPEDNVKLGTLSCNMNPFLNHCIEGRGDPLAVHISLREDPSLLVSSPL